MASGLNKHHILEAIDKLRSRKSRPDVLRIVSYVSKKYEFPKNDIKEYLEMLSKDGTVLKVEFKGSISYRNAANYRNVVPKSLTNVNEESCNIQESMSDLVAEALAQLIVQEPDYLDVGISMNELYNHIDGRYKKSLTKNYFKEILQKEVKNGNLIKFENGNYCLGYPNGDQSSLSSNVSETSQVSNDKTKEKSKSPIGNVRKYTSLSRHSSPCSSKNSHISPLAINERNSKISKPPLSRTYTKANKKTAKSHFYESKHDRNDKSELSPVRESSRRKRFQKIVFDPSDSPKPKRAKEKEPPALMHTNKKLRGPYNKRGSKEEITTVVGDLEVRKEKEEEEQQKSASGLCDPPRGPSKNPPKTLSPEKSGKKEGLMALSKQQNKTPTKGEDGGSKTGSEEESENEVATEDVKCCKICNFTIDFKSNRACERWLACQVCEKKAHVSCVEETELWTGFKLSKWQCNDCKSCVACKGTKNSNEVGLILCGLCDDAYHIKCANIKKSKTTQKWFCTKCSVVFNDDIKSEKEEFESKEATSNESSQRTTPDPEEKKITEKEGSSKTRKSTPEREEIDETIPDCSNWTCEEVYSYFLKYVLPEEADVFRDQEIDGRVLLLLGRYDVLSDFKLKLGPALKIYAQVKRLQARKNDPYLFWP